MDTWKRSEPSIFDKEDAFKPSSEAKFRARSSENADLVRAEAPPLVAHKIEFPEENPELAHQPVERRKNVASSRSDGRLGAGTTELETRSSFGRRRIAIIGMSIFVAVVTLSVVLFSRSNWNLHEVVAASESLAANLQKHTVVQAVPTATSAPDVRAIKTTDQSQNIATELAALRRQVAELSGLRQEINALASQIEQLRKTQEDFIAAQAQSAAQPQSVRKPARPVSRVQGR
jgi:cell division protein FtsB